MPACPNCGYDTAWNAQSCPNCGAPLPYGGTRPPDGCAMILGTILAIFVLGKLFGLW